MTEEIIIEYQIPYGNYPIRMAFISFFSILLGGVLAYPIVGFGGIILSFLIGSIFAISILLFNSIWNPYKVSIEQDRVHLFFRLRPSKYIFFFEIKEVFFNTVLKQPAMRLKGRGFTYSLSRDAASHLLAMMERDKKEAETNPDE